MSWRCPWRSWSCPGGPRNNNKGGTLISVFSVHQNQLQDHQNHPQDHQDRLDLHQNQLQDHQNHPQDHQNRLQGLQNLTNKQPPLGGAPYM